MKEFTVGLLVGAVAVKLLRDRKEMQAKLERTTRDARAFHETFQAGWSQGVTRGRLDANLDRILGRE